jgi:broad specificity phosphatase PhoE
MEGMKGQEVRKRGLKNDPSAESHEQLWGRLLEWWNYFILPLCVNGSIEEQPAFVLAISHGATIATLISGLVYTLKYEATVPVPRRRPLLNTSISVVEIAVDEDDKVAYPKVVLYGEARHLPPPSKVVGLNPDIT